MADSLVKIENVFSEYLFEIILIFYLLSITYIKYGSGIMKCTYNTPGTRVGPGGHDQTLAGEKFTVLYHQIVTTNFLK